MNYKYCLILCFKFNNNIVVLKRTIKIKSVYVLTLSRERTILYIYLTMTVRAHLRKHSCRFTADCSAHSSSAIYHAYIHIFARNVRPIKTDTCDLWNTFMKVDVEHAFVKEAPDSILIPREFDARAHIP